MPLESRRIALANGSTSAVVAYPDSPVTRRDTAVILAHGAGNDMHTPFLSAVQAGLAAHGYITVKFNFPYTDAGRKAPDRAPVLEACYARVLAAVRTDPSIAATRVVIGGKSLGGRMATHLAAQGAAVAGVLLLGYPLHPPKKVEQLRVAHLRNIRVPMLFIEGTRDTLCRLDLLQSTLAELSAPTTLHIIEGGDHSFNVPKALRRDPQAVWREIVTASVEWLEQLPARSEGEG